MRLEENDRKFCPKSRAQLVTVLIRLGVPRTVEPDVRVEEVGIAEARVSVRGGNETIRVAISERASEREAQTCKSQAPPLRERERARANFEIGHARYMHRGNCKEIDTGQRTYR